MSEKKTILILDVLKNAITVYFDTFFVFYFFQVANYEVVPLAKYYLTLYIFIGIGFFLIRNAMKQNLKVPYYRIGIAFQAVYIALIMLLKEQIINHIFLIGVVKGIADGFYHYPKNLLNSEKVHNENRQRHDGLVNALNKLVSVIIPLILGILLTYYSYVDIGKIFFGIFIIMFIISFNLKDHDINDKRIDYKGYMQKVKENKSVKYAMIRTFCAGLTYSSGVMGLIVTLSKINNFKTNLNLGIVDSICSALSLLVCIIFMLGLKTNKHKNTVLLCGIASFIMTVIFGIYPTRTTLIIYLISRYSFVVLLDRISSVTVTNITNDILKDEYKAEFYLFNDIIYAISRSLGYLLLFMVCLLGGMKYINYLMIICALTLLCEAISIAKICGEKRLLFTAK